MDRIVDIDIAQLDHRWTQSFALVVATSIAIDLVQKNIDDLWIRFVRTPEDNIPQVSLPSLEAIERGILSSASWVTERSEVISPVRISIADGYMSWMTRRLVRHILLSEKLATASCWYQWTSQEYWWYREFEGRRPNTHDFRKPR